MTSDSLRRLPLETLTSTLLTRTGPNGRRIPTKAYLNFSLPGLVTALEDEDRVKVVVFESAVDGFFLNHSDFHAKLEDLTSIPQGPTGLEAWPDILVRLTRAPFVSIAMIRGRETGASSRSRAT